MERRIKLTDDDLKIIANSLEDTHSSAIDTKRDLEESQIPEQDAFIEQVAHLMHEFKDRIEPV